MALLESKYSLVQPCGLLWLISYKDAASGDLFSYSSAFPQRWWRVGMKLGDENIMGGTSFFAGKAFSDTTRDLGSSPPFLCVLSALCRVSCHSTCCSLVLVDYVCLPLDCELDGGRCSVPFSLLCHLCQYRQLSLYIWSTSTLVVALQCRYCYPCFTYEGAWASARSVTCPRPYSWQVGRARVEPPFFYPLLLSPPVFRDAMY